MQKLTTNGALERYSEVMREYPQLFEPPSGGRGPFLVTDRDALVRAQGELERKAERDGVPAHYFMLGVICEDDWYMALRELVRYSNGGEGPSIRFVSKMSEVRASRTVIVVPYKDGMVMVTRRFRTDRGKWIWETPRGFAEPGLDVFSNGRRELFKETGLIASKIHPLFRTHEGGASIVLAMVDDGLPVQQGDGSESIDEVRWLTLPELEKWILDGVITDAALLAVYIYLQKMPKL